MSETSISKTEWIIENIKTNKDRYKEGDIVSISYQLKNLSPADLYVYRIGIELEWMRKNKTWYVNGEKFLLKHGETKQLHGSFNIPTDIPLGEYDVCFGLEGQFLPPSSSFQGGSYPTQMTSPIIIEVKRPLTGIKIFISHSTENMSLVRSLSNYLDNYGITTIIAENISTPGAYLPDKFNNLIMECDIFLALLTFEALRSKWVVAETNYALNIKKSCILLKEESIKLETPYEWIGFSINESEEIIIKKVINAIEAAKNNLKKPIQIPLGGIILVGILAFLTGLAVGTSATSNQKTQKL